jgi:hypothetical protein
MTFINQSFFNNSVSFGNPLAIQPEGGPVPNSLEWSKMGWYVTLRPALNAYNNVLICRAAGAIGTGTLASLPWTHTSGLRADT